MKVIKLGNLIFAKHVFQAARKRDGKIAIELLNNSLYPIEVEEAESEAAWIKLLEELQVDEDAPQPGEYEWDVKIKKTVVNLDTHEHEVSYIEQAVYAEDPEQIKEVIAHIFENTMTVNHELVDYKPRRNTGGTA